MNREELINQILSLDISVEAWDLTLKMVSEAQTAAQKLGLNHQSPEILMFLLNFSMQNHQDIIERNAAVIKLNENEDRDCNCVHDDCSIEIED